VHLLAKRNFYFLGTLEDVQKPKNLVLIHWCYYQNNLLLLHTVRSYIKVCMYAYMFSGYWHIGSCPVVAASYYSSISSYWYTNLLVYKEMRLAASCTVTMFVCFLPSYEFSRAWFSTLNFWQSLIIFLGSVNVSSVKSEIIFCQLLSFSWFAVCCYFARTVKPDFTLGKLLLVLGDGSWLQAWFLWVTPCDKPGL
jgi:hypothetical protein